MFEAIGVNLKSAIDWFKNSWMLKVGLVVFLVMLGYGTHQHFKIKRLNNLIVSQKELLTNKEQEIKDLKKDIEIIRKSEKLKEDALLKAQKQMEENNRRRDAEIKSTIQNLKQLPEGVDPGDIIVNGIVSVYCLAEENKKTNVCKGK